MRDICHKQVRFYFCAALCPGPGPWWCGVPDLKFCRELNFYMNNDVRQSALLKDIPV